MIENRILGNPILTGRVPTRLPCFRIENDMIRERRAQEYDKLGLHRFHKGQQMGSGGA
jgi:hypothetical protein